LADIPFLTFSSDHVFNGDQREPYGESSAPSPVNVYGESKVEAERAVREAHSKALVVRTSSLFSPWDDRNFMIKTLRSLRSGQPVRAIEDIWSSPTYVPDLVNTALDLLIDGEEGLLHLTNEGVVSFSDCAQMAADCVGADQALVERVSGASLGRSAKRPTFSALKSDRVRGVMPSLERALSNFIQESTKEGLL
jgi:dTDP-4-dehydrorhamnose reductase